MKFTNATEEQIERDEPILMMRRQVFVARDREKYVCFIIYAFDWITLKPHCIRCSHFKVDDVSRALEPSSKPPVRIVEDNVTSSLHRQRTP
jgi:hypothetical protein